MKRLLVLSVALLALASARELEAQSRQRLSVQISAIGNLLFGDAEATDAGFFGAPGNGYGGEVQLRYTPSAFSFGVGAQAAFHGSKVPPNFDAFITTNADQTFTLLGFFFEPRYVAAVSGNRAFYLSARLALSTIEGDNEGVGYDCEGDPFCDDPTPVNYSTQSKATGFTVNGGGGVLFALTDRVNLDLGATFGIKEFGNFDVVFDQGGTATGDLGSFTNLVLRLGLAIGLGG